MDSVNYSPSQTIARSLPRWLGSRVVKTIVVTTVVLIAISVYQLLTADYAVSQCELFPNCQLRNQELHQIRIALSKSGLTEHQIRAGHIWVPAKSHAQYLKVVADQDVLPAELRRSSQSASIGNPFLTRSQQLSIQHSQRKEKLEELINRLPFVEQAWFEMDSEADRGSWSNAPKQALVSVRSGPQRVLLDYQVQTIRELVSGAISGMASQNITVVDLDSGTAFQGELEFDDMSQRIAAQRQAAHRQRLIENRVKETVYELMGDVLEVEVKIEPWNEGVESCQLPQSTPSEVTLEKAGANQSISLESLKLDPQSPAEPARRTMGSVIAGENPCYQVHVIVDSLASSPHVTQAITRVVEMIDPTAAVQVEFLNPVNEAATELTWHDRLTAAGTEYWQVMIGLLAGLLIIGLLFSGNGSNQELEANANAESIESDVKREQADGQAAATSGNISETARNKRRNSLQRESESTKAELSKLIEQDPELAAQAIEKWLRDVA